MSWINIREPFSTKNFMALKILSTAYVLGIVLSHAFMPHALIWPIAVVFSIAMNFTYPWAAMMEGNFLKLEVAISLTLILMSVAGLISPPFVIVAIFLHGVWDLFKHNGHGVPFFKWYTNGCVVWDWLYAASLLLFYVVF